MVSHIHPLVRLDLKTILTIFGIVTGVGAGIAWAAPYIASDDPPLSGINRVQAVDSKVNDLNATVKQINDTQMFLAQGFWTREVISLEDEVKKNPENLAARQQLLTARSNLKAIEDKIYRK